MARMTDGAGPLNGEPPAVSRDRVVDPLTGLPVLRYRGPFAPTLRPGAPTPTGAWRLLRADRSGPTWVVDLETTGTATPFSEAPELADDVAVAAVLETLADAARLGLAHGALGAERLWRRGDRVWVEGYGVGWRTDASLEGDARDLARSLLALTGTSLSPGLRRRLTAIEERGDVSASPDAADADAEAPDGAAPVVDGAAATDGAHARGGEPSQDAASNDAAPNDAQPPSVEDARPRPVAVDAARPRRESDDEPTLARPEGAEQRSDDVAAAPADVDTDRHERPPTATAPTAAPPSSHAPTPVIERTSRPRPTAPPTFVKAPPPGATVRSGEDPWSPIRRRSAAVVAQATATPAGRRRAGLLVLLVAGVALLAALIWLTQRRPLPPAAGTAATTYVVDVRVEPSGLPPVRLVVLERPSGSRHEVGTVVGSVPGPVPLDREGIWRFEGQFLDRRSAPAVLDLPLERSLVLVFPDPAAP
jgi:hypothetical protein